MITVHIDETQKAGKRILKEIIENPDSCRISNSNIPRDSEGNIVGIGFDEAKQIIKEKFKEFYGVDYDKV